MAVMFGWRAVVTLGGAAFGSLFAWVLLPGVIRRLMR